MRNQRKSDSRDSIEAQTQTLDSRFRVDYGVPDLISQLQNSTNMPYTLIEKICENEKIYSQISKNLNNPKARKWLQGYEKMKKSPEKFLYTNSSTLNSADLSYLQKPKCRLDYPDRKYRVFIKTIFGNSKHEIRRKYIERTWGKNLNLIYVGFDSNQNFYDKNMLVLSGFNETRNNLSLKTYAILDYVNSCGDDHYTLITDDDVYNFIRKIEANIIDPYQALEAYDTKNLPISSCNIFGPILWPAFPFRDVKEKYFISEEEYPYEIFPEYTAGMLQVITPCAAKSAYSQSKKVPILRHLDDVWLGLLVFYSQFDEDHPRIHYQHDIRFGTGFENLSKQGKFRCDIFSLHQRLVDKKFLSKREASCSTDKPIYFSDPRGPHPIYDISKIFDS